ncbi:hypothetical protein [Streptomyces sp. NPDC057696]|uniref:hypothetical protein n=1 Tax=unclassified Streptomyces TaxID=2593676 RepID=UPI00367C25DE
MVVAYRICRAGNKVLLTLVMLAHIFLAVMAVRERQEGVMGDAADTPDLVDLTPAEIHRLLVS